MRFGLLGPLQVTDSEGEEIRIGRPKLRLLLAVLLTHANTPVPLDRLMDMLWEHDPPESASFNVRTYIWTLRGLLSPTGQPETPISTDSRGYMIELGSEQLDSAMFEQLVSCGVDSCRQGEMSAAVDQLTKALGLWRGPAYQDIPHVAEPLVAAVRRLEERRLTAVEHLCDAWFSMGMYAEAVEELWEWVRRYPLRERLTEQLMVALHQVNRSAEALSAFGRLRSHLVEQTGMEPGSPLQALQRRILQSDTEPVSPVRTGLTSHRSNGRFDPKQLPPDVTTFIGRVKELAKLNTMLGARRLGQQGLVIIIHGPAGAGKSALAVHIGSMWAERFVDGQLYVNLQDAPPGMEPSKSIQVLGRFLRALGVSAGHVPPDAEEAAVLFRSIVAGREMLILLDNAADEGRVRSLLPGTSCTVVLVTSRTRLTGLCDVAAELQIDPLCPEDARAMLELHIGNVKTDVDVADLARLADLCEYLPVALQAAASRLNARPGWPMRCLIDRLADDRRRLDELAAGNVALRQSLKASYEVLRQSDHPDDDLAMRAACLISLATDGYVSTKDMASLLDVTLAEGDRAVQRLLDVYLLEAAGADHYRMNSLVRGFARELVNDALDIVGGCRTSRSRDLSRDHRG
ncbi:BTAD domain-containing putative transcriptional regulator [Nonomuraea typhae]|uniref:BTAD domain-containing putative transcriptional regulator n=1 Tax=Nonomuraea typhae TaxID=2603600 RepID=A0ABW7YL49_9ACTN